MAIQDLGTKGDRSNVYAPISKRTDESRVVHAIRQIANTVSDNPIVRICGGNVSAGAAGIAIFQSYLSQLNLDIARVTPSRMLLHAMSDASQMMQKPSLFSGVTGVGWTLQHLGIAAESRAHHLLVGIDTALMESVLQTPWRGHYDLVDGLVGYGVYALERLAEPAGRSLLEQVISCLAEIAIYKADGATWWTAPELLNDHQREVYPQGYFNLGLAHGVPAVVGLLACCCASGVAVERAHSLLDAAVRWLLAQQHGPTPGFRYRALIPIGTSRAKADRGRVAWCYGDLGVASALYLAGASTGNNAWQQEALKLARNMARCPLRYSGVKDAWLCHGAAGNTHVFNKFYQTTGEEVFLVAARTWLQRTLQFYEEGILMGQGRIWEGTLNGGVWGATPGLLEGAAGVGLALIATISAMEPEWDRLLMLSLPRQPRS